MNTTDNGAKAFLLNRLQPYQKDIVNRAVCQKKHRLERERDEAREELAALKEMIAKSGLIEVEATTCIADKFGKPTIVKDGTMLIHKDEKLRIQQRTVDLQKHAATARKLAAERALADRLAEALKQCREDSVELLGERDWWQYEIRSDYQKRYQETRDNITRADEAIQSLTPNAKP